jgi:hypothetical protein
MDSSFNAFSKVVTKHVMGSQERFNELKERLAVCEHATSKAGAAALGYLMAMEEKNNVGNVYDKVVEQVENDGEDSLARTDQIFLAIYEWLDKVLQEEGYGKENYVRQFIANKFDSYIP